MNNTILKLENINLTIWKTHILKDVSFEVLAWETLSIIGLNWSWKSSLLKIISWIYTQTSWKIYKKYNRLSYIPQKIDVDKTIPILAIELVKIYNPNIKKEDIIKEFQKINWENILQKQVRNLSWWEFQKMLIISSILQKPDLLLLDEPTSWVDMIAEELFYEIINDIKQIYNNITIILVSHNINLVYKNSDKIICLHQNNFCCHGTPINIFKNEKVKSIFWKFLIPYIHSPHDKTLHNK